MKITRIVSDAIILPARSLGLLGWSVHGLNLRDAGLRLVR